MSRDKADTNLWARNSLMDSFTRVGARMVDPPIFQDGDNSSAFYISPVDYPKGDEILDWLDERGLGHLPQQYLRFVEIDFPDNDDAMLFKLVFL